MGKKINISFVIPCQNRIFLQVWMGGNSVPAFPVQKNVKAQRKKIHKKTNRPTGSPIERFN